MKNANQHKHIVVDARNRRSSTGRYTSRLLEHLQSLDKDNQYTILLEPDDDWEPKSKNFQAKSSKYKQFSFNPLEQIGFALQLYRLKPDLVHFTMTQQPLLYFGKIVTTTHDLTMFRYNRASRFPKWLHAVGMRLLKFLYWISHRKSSKIIVPSQYVADDLAVWQPSTKRKIVVTYEASEPMISGAAKPAHKVKKPFIFHVGSPFPHKNIHRLILAFEHIKEQHPDLQLVLVGKVKDYFKKDLDSWISKSPVKDSIIVTGFVPDSQLKWLYQNAEAYVLPSLSEGFGLPGFEAMVYQCPLISSDATCLPEVYETAAKYFDPKDIFDITHAVDSVLSSPRLRSKLIRSGQKQLKKYSWQKMARETLAVYNEVLNK